MPNLYRLQLCSLDPTLQVCDRIKQPVAVSMICQELHPFTVDEPSRLMVLIQDGTGDPFCLLGDQRNENDECPATKVNHETWETRGVIASSFDRLLWFVLSDLQGYLRPDGKFKDDDELEESEFNDDWSWYDDPDYCLQHDPDIVTFR